MRIAVGFMLVLSIWAGVPAFAQTAAEQAACKADYEKFCASVTPGGGRIIKCLNEHIDQLSEQCRQVVKKNTSN